MPSARQEDCKHLPYYCMTTKESPLLQQYAPRVVARQLWQEVSTIIEWVFYVVRAAAI
jgi:hypothetical protein